MTEPTEPSQRVLDELPERAMRFLRAISTNPYIRAALSKRGYTQELHDRGWDLMLRAAGYRKAVAPLPETPAARAALAELDAWDEPNFLVARAALEHELPEQTAFLFEGIAAAKGAGSIVSVSLLLDRLDALEKGEGRKAQKKNDQAALAKLAARGIDERERARLRELLALVRTGAAPIEAPIVDEESEATRRADYLALWAFFSEWSAIARADIHRRDHLILMGLAKRRGRKGGEGGDDAGNDRGDDGDGAGNGEPAA